MPDLSKSQLHDAFGDNRVRAKREFFRIAPERVVAALRLAMLEDVTPRDTLAVSEAVDADVRHDLEQARARRAAFNFEMVQVPVGSVLTFTRDSAVIATVTDARHVTFKGVVTSFSEAARQALADKGLSWSAVQGPLYWQLEGETLDERRRRMREGGEQVVCGKRPTIAILVAPPVLAASTMSSRMRATGVAVLGMLRLRPELRGKLTPDHGRDMPLVAAGPTQPCGPIQL